jgi:hypothetical protein
MKVSKLELQRIIREEKVRLRREDTLSASSASRKTGSISGGAGRKSRANRLRRLKEEYPSPLAPHPEELSMAKDELLGILQTMDPQERSAEIYNIIDELKTLAATGE